MFKLRLTIKKLRQSDIRASRRKWSCGCLFVEKKEQTQRKKTTLRASHRGEGKADDKTVSKLDPRFRTSSFTHRELLTTSKTLQSSRFCVQRCSCGAHEKGNTWAGKPHQSGRNYHYLCSPKYSVLDTTRAPTLWYFWHSRREAALQMWVNHRFSQPGCLKYINFSQLFLAVLTVSLNNIQQTGERDVLHSHTPYVWRRNAISPHFKPPDVNREWKSLKCTQTGQKKALNLFTVMWKIKIYLFEMSDMNDVQKKKKYIHTFSTNMSQGRGDL